MQDELEEWEAINEQYPITKVESDDKDRLANEQQLRDAAHEHLVRGIVERALLPAARRYLNRYAEADDTNALKQLSAAGYTNCCRVTLSCRPQLRLP